MVREIRKISNFGCKRDQGRITDRNILAEGLALTAPGAGEDRYIQLPVRLAIVAIQDRRPRMRRAAAERSLSTTLGRG